MSYASTVVEVHAHYMVKCKAERWNKAEESMATLSEDWLVRQAAFAHVEAAAAQQGGVVHWKDLTERFVFNGQRVVLIGAAGIWKPAQLDFPISITTSPKDPYSDSPGPDGLLHYRYQGEDPNNHFNVGLRRVMDLGRPLLYFRAVETGWYTPVWPLVIVGDDPSTLTFTLACEDVQSLVPGVPPDVADEARRKYVTRLAMVRLHQAAFRKQVLTAYRNQCTICHLKHTELLDAAHIIPDKDLTGLPIVKNGLSMCKIHHAAFDRNILGIRPDCRVEIQSDILEEIDGPMLKHGLQELHGAKLILPSKAIDQPDPERLDQRYELFLAAG
jgi:putative restriction endonuclease